MSILIRYSWLVSLLFIYVINPFFLFNFLLLLYIIFHLCQVFVLAYTTLLLEECVACLQFCCTYGLHMCLCQFNKYSEIRVVLENIVCLCCWYARQEAHSTIYHM